MGPSILAQSWKRKGWDGYERRSTPPPLGFRTFGLLRVVVVRTVGFLFEAAPLLLAADPDDLVVPPLLTVGLLRLVAPLLLAAAPDDLVVPPLLTVGLLRLVAPLLLAAAPDDLVVPPV